MAVSGGSRAWEDISPLHLVAQRCFQAALGQTEDVVSHTAEALKIPPSVALSAHGHGLEAYRVITVNGGSCTEMK